MIMNREKERQDHALEKTCVPTSSVQHHNVPLRRICNNSLPAEMLLFPSISQITGRLYHTYWGVNKNLYDKS